MGEASSEGRPPMSPSTDNDDEQQKSAGQLREEIQQTRQDLGDTVEALTEKTDVKAQAKDRLSSVKDTAQKEKDEFVATAREAAPDSATTGAQQLTATVQRKPVPFAAGGAFAAGVVVGWLLGRR
jgi:hypothetical protein